MRSKEFRSAIAAAVRSAEPADPRCPHAEQCGGCAFQERSYTGQVAAKEAVLRRLFAEAGIDQPLSLVASPDPYAYRTRMDYVATKGRFGLRMRGKFNYIVDLETCHLIPAAGFAAARAVWRRANELNVPDYNIRTHEGFLRYIVVRRSPDDQFLIAAVTAAGGDETVMERLAETALTQPGVVGFHWLVNDSLTDLSFGVARRYWGNEFLTMTLGNHQLLIGPNTFFQNNVHLLERLLHDVRLATLGRPGKSSGNTLQETREQLSTVVDLYGGVGTIAIALAGAARSISSVESVAESAVLASRNIELNKTTNVETICQDVLAFLGEQAAHTYEVAIADPPRTGLGPEVCAELLRLAPRRIVYVSCNPLTQIADLQAMATGYRLQWLGAYDMFPQTPHVETLAVLEAVSGDECHQTNEMNS